MQELIILILFATALYFVISKMYESFSLSKNGCSKGCGSCGVMDFEKLSQKIDLNIKKQSQI
jgi:hypothetical protein